MLAWLVLLAVGVSEATATVVVSLTGWNQHSVRVRGLQPYLIERPIRRWRRKPAQEKTLGTII